MTTQISYPVVRERRSGKKTKKNKKLSGFSKDKHATRQNYIYVKLKSG